MSLFVWVLQTHQNDPLPDVQGDCTRDSQETFLHQGVVTFVGGKEIRIRLAGAPPDDCIWVHERHFAIGNKSHDKELEWHCRHLAIPHFIESAVGLSKGKLLLRLKCQRFMHRHIAHWIPSSNFAAGLHAHSFSLPLPCFIFPPFHSRSRQHSEPRCGRLPGRMEEDGLALGGPRMACLAGGRLPVPPPRSKQRPNFGA